MIGCSVEIVSAMLKKYVVIYDTAFVLGGALILAWRLALDASPIGLLIIGAAKIYDWWWYLAYACYATILSYKTLKEKGALLKTMLGRLFASFVWVICVLLVAGSVLLITDFIENSTIARAIIRDISFLLSVTELVVAFWIEKAINSYRRQ